MYELVNTGFNPSLSQISMKSVTTLRDMIVKSKSHSRSPMPPSGHFESNVNSLLLLVLFKQLNGGEKAVKIGERWLLAADMHMTVPSRRTNIWKRPKPPTSWNRKQVLHIVVANVLQYYFNSLTSKTTSKSSFLSISLRSPSETSCSSSFLLWSALMLKY